MKRWLSFLFCFIAISVFAQKQIAVNSPDNNIRFSFQFIHSKPSYSVAFKGKTLIQNATLALQFADASFSGHTKIEQPIFKDTTEEYNLITGKTSHVNISYHEALIPLLDASQKRMNIRVKVFNDGIAFRYEFPQQNGWKDYTLLDENTSFNVTGDPIVHTLMFGNYTSSHEGVYQTLPLSKVVADTLMDLPALFEFSNGINMAITEAALRNYAGHVFKQT